MRKLTNKLNKEMLLLSQFNRLYIAVIKLFGSNIEDFVFNHINISFLQNMAK